MWNSTKVEKSSTEIEKQMEDYCEFNKDTSRVWKVQNSQIELAEQETVAWAKASVQIYSLYLFYPDSPKVWTQVESVCCSSVTSPLHMGRVCAAVLRKKSPGFQLANELTDFYFTFSYIFVLSLQKQKVPEL